MDSVLGYSHQVCNLILGLVLIIEVMDSPQLDGKHLNERFSLLSM